MREYLIFDMDYLDIPVQDFPERGDIIVCHDPQKRLGPITWAVLSCSGAEPEVPANALGLFWEQQEAIEFAQAKCDRIPKEID